MRPQTGSCCTIRSPIRCASRPNSAASAVASGQTIDESEKIARGAEVSISTSRTAPSPSSPATKNGRCPARGRSSQSAFGRCGGLHTSMSQGSPDSSAKPPMRRRARRGSGVSRATLRTCVGDRVAILVEREHRARSAPQQRDGDEARAAAGVDADEPARVGQRVDEQHGERRGSVHPLRPAELVDRGRHAETNQARTALAARTASTTSACCAASIVGNIGSARPSRAACSVTGSEPSR